MSQWHRTPHTKTTTERGLGYAHQQARKKALDAMREGMPCPYCNKPMYRRQRLDLDHAVPRARGGVGGPTRLAHASCNRRAGAVLRNKMATTHGHRVRVVRHSPNRKSLPKWLCAIKVCVYSLIRGVIYILPML